MKIGKSKGYYYLVIERVDYNGRRFAIPVFGPYETREQASKELAQHG